MIKNAFPNPVTEGNELKIPLNTNSLGKARVEIYDMSGKRVYNEIYYVNPGESSLVVPEDLISKLAKGFYGFKVSSKEGVGRGRFIRQSP